MAREAVARVDELREGAIHHAEAAGRSILVIKWRDEVYAVRNICPHQSQSFECGIVRASVQAVPGGEDGAPWDLVLDQDTPVVACPWHQWQFRLADGACATDPNFRVRAYATEVADDGTVFVDTAPRRSAG
jgi:nitrite reductase/ring-hydroxylating ferredoxin subunit